jgi:hypothetical protein
MNSHVLQGAGAWAQGKRKSMENHPKDKDLSQNSQYKTIGASNFNGRRSGQEAHLLDKQDERTACTVPLSRYSLSVTDNYLSMLT